MSGTTSNVSDDTLRKHIRLVAIAKRESEEANGRLRARMKEAKSDGCSTEAILFGIDAKRREEGTVIQALRDKIRVLNVMKVEVDANVLFTGWQPPEKDSPDIFGANDAGYAAGLKGQPVDDNPHIAGTEEHAEWRKAWHDGQTAATGKLQDGIKMADTSRKRPERRMGEDAPTPGAVAAEKKKAGRPRKSAATLN